MAIPALRERSYDPSAALPLPVELEVTEDATAAEAVGIAFVVMIASFCSASAVSDVSSWLACACTAIDVAIDGFAGTTVDRTIPDLAAVPGVGASTRWKSAGLLQRCVEPDGIAVSASLPGVSPRSLLAYATSLRTLGRCGMLTPFILSGIGRILTIGMAGKDVVASFGTVTVSVLPLALTTGAARHCGPAIARAVKAVKRAWMVPYMVKATEADKW